MSLGIAIKAFFAALGNREKSDQIQQVLSGRPAIESKTRGSAEPVAPSTPARAETPPSRSAAVTLLATLQREARLVDLIQEDLAKYSDAQVGAAARPCLQQCAEVLNRLMGLQPLLNASEGDSVEVGDDASPLRYQWIGEGSGSGGKLVHHGWQASKIELPTWTGSVQDVKIIAAAQIQAS